MAQLQFYHGEATAMQSTSAETKMQKGARTFWCGGMLGVSKVPIVL
eukprot:COSAG01_NODE_5584_length_4164_cov_5.739483_4_plen_46_part_00